MVSWRAAYARCKENAKFQTFFGRNGRIPKEIDFELRAYVLAFESVDPAETDGTPGPVNGPLTQEFALGAVILGVTSGCYLPQQTEGDVDYSPSRNQGRRDLYCLYFEYTNDEAITQPQNVLGAAAYTTEQQARVQSEALTGSGLENEFPQEIIVAPSNSISVSAAALIAAPYGTTLSDLCVHVVFHAMVPKEAWFQ